MRRIKKANLNEKMISFHEYKEKGILEYLSKLDNIQYLISEFSLVIKDIKFLTTKEKIKDVGFFEKIKKEFGIEYRAVYYLEILPLSIDKFKTMQEISKAIETEESIIDSKISVNKERLELPYEPITHKNQISLSRIKNGNYSANLIKKKYQEYHQEKEVFFYTLKTRLSYLRDILIDIGKTIREIKVLLKEQKLKDDSLTLELKSKYNTSYTYITRLHLFLNLSYDSTLSDMGESLRSEKEYLNELLNISLIKKQMLKN